MRARLGDDPLLVAAFDAFARFGYRRTTMSDVAAAAGMSRPAVYLRVANKEELLRQVATAVLDASLDRATAARALRTGAGAPRRRRAAGEALDDGGVSCGVTARRRAAGRLPPALR